MGGNLKMCCSVKASQQSFGTFIWSQDVSARVNKGNVTGLHFYKGAWQIYIKGRMSKRQSDGITGSGIKTWLPGRQKAMITWSASKVTWEWYVGVRSRQEQRRRQYCVDISKGDSPSKRPVSALLKTKNQLQIFTGRLTAPLSWTKHSK